MTDKIISVIYGDDVRVSRRPSNVAYRSYYDSRHIPSSYAFDSDDVVFETYESADKAMNQLRDIIKTHGFTTISDLKNLSGAYCDYLIDSRYGWTNLNDAEIVRVRGGDYSIRLPRAMAVN